MIKLIRKLLRLNKVPKRASREDLISSLYKSNTVDTTLGINYIRGSWLPPQPDKDVGELKGELSSWILPCCEAFLDTDYIGNPRMIGRLSYEKSAFLISDHLLLQETSGIVRGRV